MIAKRSLPSPIRTITVGLGICTKSVAANGAASRGLRRNVITAGQEFHPALKVTIQLRRVYHDWTAKEQGFRGESVRNCLGADQIRAVPCLRLQTERKTNRSPVIPFFRQLYNKAVRTQYKEWRNSQWAFLNVCAM